MHTSLNQATSTRNHRLSLIGIAVLFCIFAGFAETYYLKFLFDDRSFSIWVHLHALLMSLWIFLFILQVRLIALKRIDLHQRVGSWGMFLAGMALIIGTVAVFKLAFRAHFSDSVLLTIAIALFELFLFAGFIYAGFRYRHQRDFHSRFMIFAQLFLTEPAISRIPLDFISRGPMITSFLITDLIVLGYLIFDVRKLGRLHPATAWSFLLIVGTYPLTVFVGRSSTWTNLMRSLFL